MNSTALLATSLIVSNLLNSHFYEQPYPHSDNEGYHQIFQNLKSHKFDSISTNAWPSIKIPNSGELSGFIYTYNKESGDLESYLNSKFV